jgi:CheY-like chemotaxis protein
MNNSQKRILYVDDDADDRKFLSEAIKEVNPQVEVIEAENGLEALEYLDAIKTAQLPCLIVLDINMPLLDGKETFERIRKNSVFNAIPVVILSSSEKPGDKIFFNKQGADYFTKPTSISYLSTIASHIIDVCCH